MRLIIIANRLPLKLSHTDGRFTFKRSEGGLATGLSSLSADAETHWIGWPGLHVEDEAARGHLTETLSRHTFHPVFLSQQQIEDYYEGYCNNVIWPLCHYFFTFIHYEEQNWACYREVNRLFFEAAMRLVRPGDRVWVQDYHLMLLPGMLREALPDLSIGYFHHIPFPSFELFRVLPERAEVLRGLLGADLVGFHTHDYMRHFISAAYRVLGLDCDMDVIRHNGRRVQVNAFPMGINFAQFNEAGTREPVRTLADTMQAKFPKQKMMLSVDRLDYSKGVLHRLKGFARALEKWPELREKVSLVMLLVPSRATVPEYAALKKRIDEMIGELNGRYATLTWTPVHYYYRSFSQDRLLALYHVADIALVTPLRDGMNLVAKEYVAAKRDRPGVLILSELAGAALELTDALLVNPNNVEQISEAIATAVSMPEAEQLARLRRMQAHLSERTVDRWAADNLEALDAARLKNRQLAELWLSAERVREITAQAARAPARLLILDYDGTLVPLHKQPELAKPDDAVRATLTRLASDPRNTVMVCSGRDSATLDRWLGDLPVLLAAEHGAFYKEAGVWYGEAEEAPPWHEEVLPVLERLAHQTLGARVEHKRTALVWHYRNCDAWLADIRVRQLEQALAPACAKYNLHLMRGNKVVEIKTTEWNKGTQALRLLGQRAWDFVLALGDDVTDEDLFRALPPEAVTIRVGELSTAARHSMGSQAEVLPFLNALAENQSQAQLSTQSP
jgi:trehalose 6-phosphate synthase/phosphatase